MITQHTRLKTTRFGWLEVDETMVVTLPSGLVGFPEAKRFVVLEVDGEDDLYWLQSLDDGSLAFLAMAPWSSFPNYDPVLSESDQLELGVEHISEASVLCLLSVDRDKRRVTANLLGPIIINARTRNARQVVQTESLWPVALPLGASA